MPSNQRDQIKQALNTLHNAYERALGNIAMVGQMYIDGGHPEIGDQYKTLFELTRECQELADQFLTFMP